MLLYEAYSRPKRFFPKLRQTISLRITCLLGSAKIKHGGSFRDCRFLHRFLSSNPGYIPITTEAIFPLFVVYSLLDDLSSFFNFICVRINGLDEGEKFPSGNVYFVSVLLATTCPCIHRQNHLIAVLRRLAFSAT